MPQVACTETALQTSSMRSLYSTKCADAPESGPATRPVNIAPSAFDVAQPGVIATCVEINQCVGCTRQFFTKSFLWR